MVQFSTSGSTSTPKSIQYSYDQLESYARNAISTYKFTAQDIILNLYPKYTVAVWTLTNFPAQLIGAQCVDYNWNPYQFAHTVEMIKPSVIALGPVHVKILKHTKSWQKLSFKNCKVIIGSDKVDQITINDLQDKGATVYHTYGMTENPPPVCVGVNSEWLDLNTVNTDLFKTSWHQNELVINGEPTGDLFEKHNSQIKFIQRKNPSKNITWKHTNYYS